MARLIPRTTIDDIALKPERDVARALVEQLPNDFIVYHSYPWLRSDRNDAQNRGVLHEGETDFVVVDPKLGFLVLEVKGGEIAFDSASHLWYRVVGRTKKQITDPFEQARKSCHYLQDRIRERSFPTLERVPCVYGYAVVFPDCNYAGDLPPGAEHAIVLSTPDMPFLDRRVREVLRQWDPRSNPKQLTDEQLNGIVSALSPAFQLMPVLYRQLEQQEEHLVRLTNEQMRLLDFLTTHPRAAIKGVAGSGKTLLARAQAQRFAEQGKRTLFVCYNKALAEWIRSSMPESFAEKITVRHFHGLCRDWCVKVGMKFDVAHGDGQDDFWRDKAPELLLQAMELGAEKFDAVVVDEGQDFHPLWYMALNELNRDGEFGAFYVFYDPVQNLFMDDGFSLPNLGAPYDLLTNCRNTRNIADVCGRINDITIPTRPDAPEGHMAEFKVLTSPVEQHQACEGYVRRWLRTEKLKPAQIAILSPFSQARSSLQGVRKLGDVRLVDDHQKWRQGEGVLFSSIRAFKGLEADAVVMIDVPVPDEVPFFKRSDFYVGASRAKHMLVILAQDESVVRFIRGRTGAPDVR